MISAGFTHILIPVDLSKNSEVAIKKGIKLAQEGATISLLHIRREKMPLQKKPAFEAETEMNEWKEFIERTTTGIRVNIWISPTAIVQKTITDFSNQLKADLIIIVKQRVHYYFPFLDTVSPGDLVKKCGCAVLTVKPGAVEKEIRTILVYIGCSTRVSKMEALKTICRKFKVRIYFVVFNDKEFSEPFSPSGFLQTYQWLKSFLHCPVEYTILDNRNKATALFNYGRTVNADMILIHGIKELRTGLMKQNLHDILPAASKMQVLAIH
jgi:hypothetical protein